MKFSQKNLIHMFCKYSSEGIKHGVREFMFHWLGTKPCEQQYSIASTWAFQMLIVDKSVLTELTLPNEH